jgi:adenylate cyclase
LATEIERKFLVQGNDWRAGARGVAYRQGYLTTDPERTVRVRIAGDRAFLTIKGKTRGATRAEFEYPIPVADGNALLDQLCLRPLIEKTRFRIEHAGWVWEVDEFFGENEGLVLAEVELRTADDVVDLPEWAGQEVSDDSRYYNASLVELPFSRW